MNFSKFRDQNRTSCKILGTKTIVYLLFYSSKVIPFNSVSWNVSYLCVVNFEKWMEGQN
jgi:uncharacterized membrane protein YesL